MACVGISEWCISLSDDSRGLYTSEKDAVAEIGTNDQIPSDKNNYE